MNGINNDTRHGYAHVSSAKERTYLRKAIIESMWADAELDDKRFVNALRCLTFSRDYVPGYVFFKKFKNARDFFASLTDAGRRRLEDPGTDIWDSKDWNKYKVVVCADGFKMSIQAGQELYCAPYGFGTDWIREDYDKREEPHPDPTFTHVEVACGRDGVLENMPGYDCGIFYMAPADVISDAIKRHGGLVSGEVPKGINTHITP